MGGTTYFYQAAGSGVAADSTPEESVIGVEEPPAAAGLGVTMYTGNPSHVTSAKTLLGASADGHFYMSDDIRLEMLQKNSVTLTQPDPTAFPGHFIIMNFLGIREFF